MGKISLNLDILCKFLDLPKQTEKNPDFIGVFPGMCTGVNLMEFIVDVFHFRIPAHPTF